MSDLRPERLHLQDNDSQHISICGKSFFADANGALFWPSERALIIADLGLGDVSNSAARGASEPVADTKDNLVKLANSIDYYQARTVIALGLELAPLNTANPDHTPAIDEEILQILEIMQEDCEWIWIDATQAVNNSSSKEQNSNAVPGGTIVSKLCVNDLTLTHRPSLHATTHEIAGHLHPAARISTYGHVMRRPCFIGNGKRLILPAYGSYSGGVNVLDAAFDTMFGQEGLAVWLMGQEGVYPVSSRRLTIDP